MSEIGLHRGLAGFGVGLSVGLGVRGNTTNGRQDKSAAFGRAHVVGWVGLFRALDQLALLALHRKCPRNSTPRAPSPALSERPGFAMTTRDDDLRVRPGRIRHGNRRQASEELCRRGDASREEGRPYRRELRAEPAATGRSTLRPGPARALCLCRSRSTCAARGDQGPRRPSPRHAIPFGAARQTHRLSRSARASPATARTPGCSMRRRTSADERTLSPSGARMTGTISGSSSRPRMRRDGRPADLHPRADGRRRTRSRHQARLGGGRSLEHRQSAHPCPDPRPGRRRPGPGHQPRLHQPGLPRPRRRARHPGAGAAQRAARSERRWRRRSRPSAGPASTARCAISPTRAAASPTCARARRTKTRSCAG